MLQGFEVRSRRQRALESESYYRIDSSQPGTCMHFRSEEGIYEFVSDGTDTVCALYIISDPEYIVEFEFHSIDVSCLKGLVAVIDGWELNGQFFPGEQDHPKAMKYRFTEYCGIQKILKPFRTSQNVGLIQFHVPRRGEGYTVSVRFRPNKKPCNAVMQWPDGVYTMRNYGRNINCTIAFVMKSERFRVVAASIGTQAYGINIRQLDVETGLVSKCSKRGISDFVEIKGGFGLDPEFMMTATDLCGTLSTPSKDVIDVACSSTAIRLVSSGQYENSVTISFEGLNEEHLSTHTPTLICPFETI
ncbi:corticotropin-releasing factor-binding protein-like [Tachypleus tridentatus]|uniref:corticotropin-releasing factor-binding protein-like n=1 Tax=Tachypleus tridentatus TaxID=6853 RepID=UPI003FD040F1